MKTIKIMPCLDMRDGRVVKGINFVDIRDVGDPVEHACFYEKEGADELAVLDISATLENRKTRLEWVKSISSRITIPLTVGGGISTLEDIDRVLGAGADRVLMNSAAVSDPGLIEKAARSYGTQTVTIALDGRRNPEMPSGFELVVSGGTKPIARDVAAWAVQCQDLGAGILLPTSMDGDGTRKGYDIAFIRAISEKVEIPVVASGGAGELEHFHQGVTRAGAEILLAASVFHYRTLSIAQVKNYLHERGIRVNR